MEDTEWLNEDFSIVLQGHVHQTSLQRPHAYLKSSAYFSYTDMHWHKNNTMSLLQMPIEPPNIFQGLHSLITIVSSHNHGALVIS